MASIYQKFDEADQLKGEGKFEEAIEIHEAILAEDESIVQSHLSLAVLYGKLSKHEQATQHGQRACELDPSDPFHFTALSVTFRDAATAAQDPETNQRYIMLAEDAMAKAHMMQGRM